jgi:hypothetical protein
VIDNVCCGVISFSILSQKEEGLVGGVQQALVSQALHASQALFATYLNVSTNAVRSSEQGTRRPRQAALKLLVIAKKNPKALLVASKSRRGGF